MVYFTEDYINFFKELGANNHKEWFDQNRKRYESTVREPFKVLVAELIKEIEKKDKSYQGLEPKHCLFRINRDIRFSKDKTPYKTNFSALITPGGKKQKDSAIGVYFEMSAEHVRVYGGVYEVDKDNLYFLREGIMNNLKEFKKLYSNKSFVNTFGEIRGEKNKIIPKEFKEAGEKEPLIYNKQFYFFSEFDPTLVHQDELKETILKCYNTGLEIQQFLHKQIAS